MARFLLGQLLTTAGALAAAEASGDDLITYVNRHARGDWGDLSGDDKRANDRAMIDGTRLFSAYHLSGGVKVWVITESDRAATTILLPAEY